ncbi:MAG: hypothetical protein MI974_24205 [Chitinophagales bacterium]|nr:hypothetical protein [Chitinophagales bacterium]
MRQNKSFLSQAIALYSKYWCSDLESGAKWGLIIFVCLFMGYSGFCILRLGYGIVIDIFIGSAGSLLLLLLIRQSILFVLNLFKVPSLIWLGWLGGGITIPLIVFRFSRFHWITVIPLTVLASLSVVSFCTALIILFRNRKCFRKPLFLLAFSLCLLLFMQSMMKPEQAIDWENVNIYHPMIWDTQDIDYTKLTRESHHVETLLYGSGVNQVVNFNKQLDWETPCVDMALFLKPPKGIFSSLREGYWGFDHTSFPLNATVWCPEKKGKFPVVLILHGDFPMRMYSDTGYAYLGHLLASRGFLTLSIDQRFLNLDWTGHYQNEMDARAYILLEHLQLLRKWNETKGHRLYGKADLNNVVLIGHSKGGEAIAVASYFNNLPHHPDKPEIVFDYGFDIKALVGLAPSDCLYQVGDTSIVLEDIDYLLLHGAQDADVSQFYGDRQFKRIRYFDQEYHFKSSLFIYRANHGQFNSAWGANDLFFPASLLLNKAPLISQEEQQRIAELYISAFLETSIRKKMDYLPLFQDYRYACKYLPSTYYINRFCDTETNLIADFGSQMKNGGYHAAGFINHAVVGLPFRRPGLSRQNPVLHLKWDHPAILTIDARNSSLPSFRNGVFTFSLADLSTRKFSKPLDFKIELTDTGGACTFTYLKDIIQIVPKTPIELTRFSSWENSYGNKQEPVLQTISIPMQAFQKEYSPFDINKLQTIRFYFDQGAGEVYLDEVGVRGVDFIAFQ